MSPSRGSRVKLHVPREESFLIPMKYVDVARNTHTSLDVMLEKNKWHGPRVLPNQGGERRVGCLLRWVVEGGRRGGSSRGVVEGRLLKEGFVKGSHWFFFQQNG